MAKSSFFFLIGGNLFGHLFAKSLLRLFGLAWQVPKGLIVRTPQFELCCGEFLSFDSDVRCISIAISVNLLEASALEHDILLKPHDTTRFSSRAQSAFVSRSASSLSGVLYQLLGRTAACLSLGDSRLRSPIAGPMAATH